MATMRQMAHNGILMVMPLAALAVLAGCGGNRAAETAPSVYVSPQGDDANPGTEIGRPLRTPQVAAEKVRALRRAGKISGDAIVEFADGTYSLADPVRFDANDSGTIWRAAHRGRAVFTGTTKLVWRKLEDENVKVLLPETVRGKVMVADIPGDGELPSFRNGHVKETPSNALPIAVYCGDERLNCARWPNDAFARTGQTEAERVGVGERSKVGGKFAFDRHKLEEWSKEPFAWVFGLWGVEWAHDSVPLTDIDPKAGQIRLSKESIPFGLKRGMPFYVFNAFSEIDRPGEWVVDRERRRLYLWPKETGPSAEAILTDGLIDANGVKDFVLDGFVFEKTRRTVVQVKDCERLILRASIVRHANSWGVDVRGGRNCRVTGCDLYDLGEGGVRLEGGHQEDLARANHVVENCHVHHYGRTIYNYRDGIALYGTGNSAVHNLVHHAFHTGIYFAGNDHYVGYNVVHDVCEFNDDAGAIYSWQNSWVKRGGVVEHNVIHMIGKKRFPSNTEGIYLDDFSSEVVVRGNLVNRATCGIKVGGGQSHVICGNVLMNCLMPVNLDSRKKWPDPQKGRDGKLWRTIDSDPVYSSPLWRSHYPGLARLLDYPGDAVRSHYAFWNVITNNMFVASGECRRLEWDVIGATTTWTNNVAVGDDPGFVDWQGLNWKAKDDSRFHSLIYGCRFVDAGLYDSPDRITPAVKFGDGVSTPGSFGEHPLAKPVVNLAVQLRDKLPEGVKSFAENPLGCEVPDWSKGRWIFARYDCNPDVDAPWERFAYSFVPTCDCMVTLVAMGGTGECALYDDIRIEGAEVGGPIFGRPQPFKANDRQRVHSAPVRCRKGTPVKVFFRAKSAEGFERGPDARKTVIEVAPGGRIGSLEAARDEIRAIRAKNGGKLPNRIEVVFGDGVYPVGRVVDFDCGDSGEDAFMITYRAKNRGKAVFSGGLDLQWKPLAADDPARKLLRKSVVDEVRVAEVPEGAALGDFSGGRMQPNGYPLWLFADGRPMPLAAWPDSAERWDRLGDEFEPLEAGTADFAAANAKDRANARVKVSAPRLGRWPLEPELWTYGFWQFEWDDAFTKVKAVDAAKGVLTIDASRIEFGPTAEGSYRMVNAFCELDKRGEWVLDRRSRRLYAWLPEGRVTAASAERFVVAKGLRNVRFSGFAVDGFRGDLFRFEGCRDLAVEASEIRASGGYAVLCIGCTGCRIEGCDIHDLGEGGILLSGGDERTLAHSDNAAVNNHVHHYGWRLPCYRPGITTGSSHGTSHPRSVGARVEHNLIHHARHMAIGFGGYEDTIGFNVIHDTCSWSSDAGAIYGYSESDWSVARGTVIEYNTVYMSGKPNYTDVRSIYVDGIVSGVTVRGNLAVRATFGLFQNGGQANVWERNVAVACRTGASRNDLGYTGIKHTRPDSVGWKALQADRALYHSPPWIDRHPELARQSDIADPAWAQCSLFCVHSNNVFAACGHPRYQNERLKGEFIVTNELEVAGDPGFVDYAGFDWRLKPGSPAQAVVGDLPFAGMGLFANPLRFSPAVKFGEGLTPHPPLRPMLGAPRVSIHVHAEGRTFTKENPMATGLVGCTDDLDWCKERNRILAGFGEPFVAGRWRTYAFSFVPTFTGEALLEVRGGYGAKTCYDDFKAEGCALVNGGLEVDGGWFVPKEPPDYAIRLQRSDLSRPWGIVTGGADNPAASGRRFLAANDDLVTVQRIRATAGTPVRVSFRATAWRQSRKE